VRMPASWRMNRPARPQVKVTVGGNAPSQLGMWLRTIKVRPTTGY
jgi:hypothetical protein